MRWSIRQAGAFISSVLRVACAGVTKKHQTLLRLAKTQLGLRSEFLPLGHAVPADRSDLYPSPAGIYNQSPSTSEIEDQLSSTLTPDNRLVLCESNHKGHATLESLWDDLHKPRQLGLEQLSIPELWERLFYGP
jgi:hypothetical protein